MRATELEIGSALLGLLTFDKPGRFESDRPRGSWVQVGEGARMGQQHRDDQRADSPTTITVPWGNEQRLDLAWPKTWSRPTSLEPHLEGAIADYPAAVDQAWQQPIGDSGRVVEHCGPGTRVAIVVDDPSRWTPVADALKVVLPRLHEAGVRDEDLSISIGVGRHRPVDRAGMIARLGREVVDRYRCYSPPVDDRTAYDDLGRSPDGIPVRIFAPVARADVRILIGSILPHLQAGFGGGWKLVMPGTSHRSTLASVHRHGLDRREGREPGQLLGQPSSVNPMRQAIVAAAGRLSGRTWGLNHLLGPPGTVLAIAHGEPEAVQAELEIEARRRFSTRSEFQANPVAESHDLVVAGNSPWPGDPMMSFKVLLQNRAAGRPGGVMVGLFWTDPQEWDRTMPVDPLRRIARSGSLGSWVIRHGLAAAERFASTWGSPKAFLMSWARELVVDRQVLVYAPPLHEAFGSRLGPVRLFAELPALWREVERVWGRPPQSSLILPQGGLTYTPAERPERSSSPGSSAHRAAREGSTSPTACPPGPLRAATSAGDSR